MSWRPSKDKPIKTRSIAAALLLAVVVFGAAFWLVGAGGAPKPSNKGFSRAVNALYEEALTDMKAGRLLDAAGKLSRIDNIKPGYKKTNTLLKQIAGAIVAQAKEDIAGGDTTAAKDKLDGLKDAVPDNKVVDDVIDTIDNGTDSPESNPPAQSKLNDPNATPASVLASGIDGYESKNSWDNDSLAGDAFGPKGEALKNEVETVLVVVGKLDAAGAQKRFMDEKKLFPDNPVDSTVNDQPAYSGFSAGIMVLTWTQDRWFFSVQVIPNQSSSVDFLRGTAKDVAEKLGV